MATTTTTSGAVTTGAQQITLAAFSNPGSSAIGPLVIGEWASGERVLITDSTYSPTVQVVRGYAGTVATTHSNLEGFTYGLSSDSYFTGPTRPQIASAVQAINAQQVTLTGATGSTAATTIAPWGAALNLTGASGAGLNLPIPVVGSYYTIFNSASGAANIYCVGGTINGTTGTTAVPITTTGNKLAIASCATAGAWLLLGNT